MALRVNKSQTQTRSVTSETEPRHKIESTQRGFSVDLSKEADQQVRERLEELLGKIQQQGKRLGQTPTFSELKSYRELVKKFMSEAVGQMYDVESGTGWDRRGRQKAYTLVKKVDETLESLTEDVRQGQQRQLAILDKMDSIRGMLVDMYT
ncbi:MAG TPA: YaaR family protein [Negativicutes bacterium]|nr:YaaR family protein [Negativicutes bacterium]